MRRRCLLLALMLVVSAAIPARALMVSAAASLRDAVERIARTFERESGVSVHRNFGGSGVLRRQIEGFAPVDVFISAGWPEIERLQRKGLVAGAPLVVARNRLVVIVPDGSPWCGRSAREVLTSRKVGRIATGDPDAVPFGHYARAALTSIGVWQDLEGRLVFASHVRQALNYAERGAVDAAIVYQTDARLARHATSIGEVPGSEGLRIESVAVRIAKSRDPAAPRFLAYLASPEVQRVLTDYGFLPPAP